MKIQSDIITTDNLFGALASAGIHGVNVDIRRQGRGRNFTHSYDVTLYAEAGRDTEGKNRRTKNSGNYGADYRHAATYREHGWWMVQLFNIDPNARVAGYHGIGDFHAQTRGDFLIDMRQKI